MQNTRGHDGSPHGATVYSILVQWSDDDVKAIRSVTQYPDIAPNITPMGPLPVT